MRVAEELKEQILWAVREFNRSNGYSPSFRQLAQMCKCSLTQVHYHLGVLKAEGRVDYVPTQPRTLVVKEAK